MSEKIKDILSHLSTDIDQETLLQYLQGKLSPEKSHELEKQLLESDFHSEALEGLEAYRDKQQLRYTVEMLNRDLRRKTAQRRKRVKKFRLDQQPWLYIAILLLLLLIVLSYFVVTRLLAKGA